jgi:hypothetical protein
MGRGRQGRSSSCCSSVSIPRMRRTLCHFCNRQAVTHLDLDCHVLLSPLDDM